MFKDTIAFIRQQFNTEEFIPLHEPRFIGNEKQYLEDCIDSTFVSSVGAYVNRFEADMTQFTGAKHAVATVNGTAALHVALLLAGVERDDEVITQPLTFIATCNALSYIGAHPVFVDVDKTTLGLSPDKLEHFLKQHTEAVNGVCINTTTKRPIKAVVPMHTFGLPVDIRAIAAICRNYNIALVEDAAESLGSYYQGQHTGTFGLFGTLSFNGNKTITTGGGGMILTNDSDLAKRAKHITTTAKLPHRWDFEHDQIAFNYRLPNLNAALGCAQLESLPGYLENKRQLAMTYKAYFENQDAIFIDEPKGTQSNFWLNALLLKDRNQRDLFLEETNDNGVMTRPIWKLMNTLPMFQQAQTANLDNAEWLEERIVNIPSSVRL